MCVIKVQGEFRNYFKNILCVCAPKCMHVQVPTEVRHGRHISYGVCSEVLGGCRKLSPSPLSGRGVTALKY